MTSVIKNVLIIGAGGHLGPAILSAFLADASFNVSVLSRDSSMSTFPAHVKVHRVSNNYPEAELIGAFQGQDAIISTIATAGIALQELFIDAAIKAGVKRFVPSEFGGDTLNKMSVAVIPQYFKGKLETVEYLKAKEKEGLTWTAFITGPFFDKALQMGFLGHDVTEQKVVIFNDGKTAWSTTTSSTIGLAVKNALLIPEKTANQYLYINSFTVSQNQVLASLEKATGKRWQATYVDAEEQKKAGLEKMAKGDFSGAISLIRYICTVPGYGGNFAEYEKTANELLSLPKQTLDEVVADVLNN